MENNFYDFAFKIDELIEEYSQTNLKEIESYFEYEGVYEYFLKKLASSSNPSPWLKHLKEKGYFDPENNPPPQEVLDKKGYFTIPYWNVLRYLENVAVRNVENPSNEITELLLEIIDSIVNYWNEEGKKTENYRTDWILAKIIFKLPLEKITEKHIDFIEMSLKSKWDTTLLSSEISKTVLPKLIDNNAKKLLLKLIDVILGSHKTEGELTEKYTSVMDNFWLNEALKKHKPAIAELCGIEAAEIALSKMHVIINEDKSQFNTIWIPAIENHPQTHFPDKYECQLVHFVRDMFELSTPDQVKGKINGLIKEEHPIFKRIAIHIINYYYEELNELFWNWGGNPLDENWLKHELYELFRNNCLSFTDSQIKKVLNWIESKDYYIADEIKNDKERIEKMLAYKKKEWLSSLLETKNPEVISLHEKYNQMNPTNLDHPSFETWSEAAIGWPGMIEEFEFLDKSNEEIAEYLVSFKEKKEEGKLSELGLRDALRNCVSENSKKFAIDMNPFLNAQRIYQNALLWGLSEAWHAKKDFPWEGLLNFMSQIIASNGFWDEDYHDMVSWVASLIEDGTTNDDHAFDAEFLPQAEKILLTLAEKTESDLPDMGDLVSSVLNSSKGKIFSAMVNYSLRYARLFKKDREDRWTESIKEDFTKRLDREIEQSLEFSVILGEYLANLYYLDEKWVSDNINLIFPKNIDVHWGAAFTGYLFYSPIVYKNLYFLLRENSHYTKALQTHFRDDHITERFVQHTCIGYLEDLEKLDDETSLISRMINNKNVNQFSDIVSFFWMLRDKLTEKIKAKVKPLWKELFGVLSQEENETDYQKVISNLSRWLSLIDCIDEQVLEWLKLSAKYILVNFDSIFFIEYLLNHTSKTPAEVGEIYLEMLNAGRYPDYKKEDIQKIVQTLYEQNQKKIADRICNLYGAKGFDFLRDIYREFQH